MSVSDIIMSASLKPISLSFLPLLVLFYFLLDSDIIIVLRLLLFSSVGFLFLLGGIFL